MNTLIAKSFVAALQEIGSYTTELNTAINTAQVDEDLEKFMTKALNDIAMVHNLFKGAMHEHTDIQVQHEDEARGSQQDTGGLTGGVEGD